MASMTTFRQFQFYSIPVRTDDKVRCLFSERQKKRHIRIVNTLHLTHTHVAAVMHACICSAIKHFSWWKPPQGIRSRKILPSRFSPHSHSIFICLYISYLCQMSQQKCNCSLIWLVSCVSMSHWNEVARDAVPKSLASAHMVPTWEGVHSSLLLHLDTRVLATNAHWLDALYTYAYRACVFF